ncbi:MAG: aromatic ring-hydroxylating dioxygenase subunit alpha [Tissierellia bacterium]|jgi:phenylpropionate dioxygenase-like ring-hydroxylating dioxygenase large terminal subunit|nr:aromatic ring-hydroxylating dioxygenase subunit alpha [Tissierellia bacterium]
MINNSWYAVLDSGSVKKNEVVGAKRLNKNLAFFRDENETIHCVMDICAHRGAALSLGTVKDDCIKCPFHGIEYHGDGSCEHVPSDGISSDANYSRFNLKSYFVKEKNDIIYLWNGDEEPTEEINFFEVLEDKDLVFSELQDPWNTHYSRVIENQLDVSHLSFVHHNTIGRGYKTLVNGPKVVWLDEYTLQTSANNEVDTGQKPKTNEESVIKSTNLTFKYPNSWLNTISDKIKVMAYFVPIDEENSILCIRFYNKITGFKPLDKFISWVGKYANMVIEKQDKRIVETQLPKKTGLKMKENLVKADMPIIEYRKRRNQLIKENEETKEDE